MPIPDAAPNQIQAINPTATAESLYPDFPDDSDKTRYLAFRATGFSITESCKLLAIDEVKLKFWRTYDSLFAKLEAQTESEPRIRLGLQIMQRAYLRNFHLLLLQDQKALENFHKDPENVSERQFQYLLKATSRYNPQYLQLIMGLDGGQTPGQTINFSQLVLQVQQILGNKPVELLK